MKAAAIIAALGIALIVTMGPAPASAQTTVVRECGDHYVVTHYNSDGSVKGVHNKQLSDEGTIYTAGKTWKLVEGSPDRFVSDGGAQLQVVACDTAPGNGARGLGGVQQDGVQAAQTSTTLVSNTGRTQDSTGLNTGDIAQAFTTGSNAGGYRLTKVKMYVGKGSLAPNLSLSIRADSSGVPGSSVGTLTTPALTVNVTFVDFTASGGGIDLEPNKTYWVVVDLTNVEGYHAGRTNSNAEDTGAAAGWTIADGSRYRTQGATNWPSGNTSATVIQIAIEGSAKTVTTTPVVLVGNNDKADAGTLQLNRDRAQAFTTGNNAAGYRLTSVEIASNVTQSVGNWDVSIVSASGSQPGTTQIGDLSEPSGLTTGIENSFTASGNGIDLDPNKTYYIFIDMDAEHSAHWKSTNSDDENANPATGWTIGNASYFRQVSSTTTTWTQLNNNNLKIRVNGYTKVTPVVTGATVNYTSLVLTFDNNLDTTSRPAANRFTISEDGGAPRAATAISISGNQVRLTVPAVTGGRSVTVSYSKPTSNPLKGATGADVAAFAAQAVTNETTPPPAVTSAQINGATLILHFDQDLDTGSGTAARQFTIEAGGSSHAATAISISVRQVRLTVPAVRSGQFVTVSYSKTASNPLKGSNGADVAAFAAQAVTNNTPGDTASGTVRAPITVTYTNADGEVETVENRAASADRETLWDYFYDSCSAQRSLTTVHDYSQYTEIVTPSGATRTVMTQARNGWKWVWVQNARGEVTGTRAETVNECASHGMYLRQSNCANDEWVRRNPHLLDSVCPDNRTW